MKCLVEVFWSDDDGGYIAVVPDLPGCSAFGDNAGGRGPRDRRCHRGWIGACRANGDPVPEPTTKARRAA